MKGLTEEDTGTEDKEKHKSEIAPGRKYEKVLGNQNHAQPNIKSSQIRTPYEENLNLSPTETKTLVPTETSLGQRIHIENDVLQMREKMFEKIDKVWTCKVCEFSSHNSGHLREHVEKHVEGVEYPCNLCGKIMRSSASLRSHHSMKRCPFAKSNQ